MKKLSSCILVAALLFCLAACTIEPANAHIYDDAEIVNVMSGSGTEKIGTCSITKAWAEDVTEEALADWYFNHVEPGGYNWAVIVYLDRPGIGVYGNSGVVEKDVMLELDDDGSYFLGSEENATIYAASDGKLVELSDN